MENTKKALKKVRSIQNSIYYDLMLKNGLCILDDNGTFSATIKFEDINYQIATQEDQIKIFNNWMETLNMMGNEYNLQLILQNHVVDDEEFQNCLFLEKKEDKYQLLRNEWNDILKQKLAIGNNRIVTDKYLTFTFMEDSIEKANRFAINQSDEYCRLMSKYGVKATPMDGSNRLKIIHRALFPNVKYTFNYNKISRYLTSKDAISPEQLAFKEDHFIVNGRYCRILYISDYSTELSDELLNQLSKIKQNLTIALNMRAIPRGNDIAMVKNKLMNIESEIANYQQKGNLSGYDGELNVPLNLKEAEKEAQDLLQDLQKNNQRLFESQFLIFLNCESREELETLTTKIKGIANKRVVGIRILRCQQEEGMNACFPIGYRVPKRNRTLTSAGCSIFVPFSVQEMQEKMNSLYYGVNSISKNLITIDRKKMKNSNAWYFGQSGSGKSMACKREMFQVMCKNDNDELIVIDPENEYQYLARELGGSIINIDSKAGIHINPLEYDQKRTLEGFVKNKADFCQTFIAQIFAQEMSAEEKSVIDRAVREMYTKYFLSLKTDKPLETPTLKDLLLALENMDIIYAQRLATGLEMYVNGTYDLFSGFTNINLSNRFTVFNISETESTIQPLAMLVILENLWDRINYNHSKGIRTWIWIDEIYLLFKNEYTANFLFELFKRARKYGALITGITQNITDLSKSETASTMLSNSEFIVMLAQSEEDKIILGNLLNVPDEQLSFLSNKEIGKGLIYVGNKTVIPFVDNIPKGTRIYNCMTSTPEERVALDRNFL